jgi:hypothetical protein
MNYFIQLVETVSAFYHRMLKVTRLNTNNIYPLTIGCIQAAVPNSD